MHFRPLPPAEYLRERLSYDPESGALTFKRKTGFDKHDKQWNTKFAGRVAGCRCGVRGYVMIKMDQRSYLAHRLIWKIMTGDDVPEIDHKNGATGDNRWDNLRAVTHTENQRNQKKRRDTSSGFKGVYWNKALRKWSSQISYTDHEGHRRHKHLGSFDIIEDAAFARKTAEQSLFGEFRREEAHGG